MSYQRFEKAVSLSEKSVCRNLTQYVFRKSVKAIEAAIHSRQWTKVIQIVEAQEEGVARKYYNVIADHFNHVGEHAQAERYVEAMI